MSDTISIQHSLESIQKEMAGALEERDAERVLELVTQREPLLQEFVAALNSDESLKAWAEDYWHRDQVILNTAQTLFRRTEGQVSAYRIKRKVSDSYMANARYTAAFIRENPPQLRNENTDDGLTG